MEHKIKKRPGSGKREKSQLHPGRKERRLIIEINKDIEKYQESVAMGLSAKQLVYSILALGSGCGIVFLLYEKIGLTFSCYVAVPIVAPIALCGFIPTMAWDSGKCSPGT